MSTRRGFLKSLAVLPIIATTKKVFAAPTPKVDTGIKVICPHCFELDGMGHTCEGYRLWLKQNPDQ